ncbi:MAG: DUF3365 domain-containing protein [Pseudomonadales bacterium]|nr:DUF3365 domain-containing protein [Pseudomonadales bacterium]
MSRCVLLVLMCVLAPDAVSDDDIKALHDEAVGIVGDFAGELKPALMAAMQEGGPVHAIDVCSERAPEIAERLSAESGWSVSRVSLKPRNRETGQPDAWARAMLATFDARQKAGEPAENLVVSEVADGEFRFLKAQPVEPLCLACHGKALAPAVREKLAERYPDDHATAYSLGQVRGGFYLRKTL